MRKFQKAGIIVGLCCLACLFINAGAKGQTIYFGVHNIALKSGESAELGQVYYIGATCKSLLKARPRLRSWTDLLASPPQSERRWSFLVAWVARSQCRAES